MGRGEVGERGGEGEGRWGRGEKGKLPHQISVKHLLRLLQY